MKKLVKGVAAALAVTMLAGCGASASSSTTEQASSSQATAQTTTADGKSVIRVGIGSDPASFGPFEAGGNGKNATFRTIYEPLAEYQGVGGECKAVVAKSWEKVGDMTYHLTIWDNVYDTAGNHFTADDVVFVCNSMKETGNFVDFRYMDTCTKIDDYTVELVMNSDIIGQFGVGFYSAFMVGKKVRVVSRAIGSDETWAWESDGVDGYDIKPAERAEHGTDVIVYLKDDTADESFGTFASEHGLTQLIKRYSNYVRYPIQMVVTKSRMKPRPADALCDDDRPDAKLPPRRQRAPVALEPVDVPRKLAGEDAVARRLVLQLQHLDQHPFGRLLPRHDVHPLHTDAARHLVAQPERPRRVDFQQGGQVVPPYVLEQEGLKMGLERLLLPLLEHQPFFDGQAALRTAVGLAPARRHDALALRVVCKIGSRQNRAAVFGRDFCDEPVRLVIRQHRTAAVALELSVNQAPE